MKIKKMTATFGVLDHAVLIPGEGLTVITAPNEAGKSTWAGFLKAMFYGIDTRERDKAGHLADKNRYQPWSGAPMEGELQLEWECQDITLRRFAAKGSPFSGFEAVYTASGDPVPGLTSANVGAAILGVGREVYLRSAFVGQGKAAVTPNGELEARIAALATSGQEDVSYSTVERTLKDWRNRRRANRSNGLLPELEEELAQAEQALQDMGRIRAQAQADQERLASLEAEQQRLKDDVALWDRIEKHDLNRRYGQALADQEAAQAALDALSPPAPEMDGWTAQEAREWAQQEQEQYQAAVDERRKLQEQRDAIQAASQKKARIAVILAAVLAAAGIVLGVLGGLGLEAHRLPAALSGQVQAVLQEFQHLPHGPIRPVAQQVGQADGEGGLGRSQGPGPAKAVLKDLKPDAAAVVGIGEEKGEFHIAHPEDPALGEVLLQLPGGLVEEGVPHLVAEAAVDVGKLLEAQQDDVEPLPAGQAEGELIAEAVAVAHAGEAVQLHPSALEADVEDEVGHGDDGAVEKDLGVEPLEDHEQHHQRGEGAHDVDYAPADAPAVAEVAHHQGQELHGEEAVAQGVEGPALVGVLVIKVEEDAAPEVPEHCGGEEQDQDDEQPPGLAEAAAVVDMLQDEIKEVGCHHRGHDDDHEEIEAVEEQVEPQGQVEGVVDGEDTQDVEQDGAHGEPQADLVHLSTVGGRLLLTAVGEHQQRQNDGGEQLR